MIAAGVIALSAASCQESWTPDPVGQTGTLSLKSMGVNVNTSANVYSRADGAIDLNPYLVSIVPLDGAGQPSNYTFGTMPEVLTLPLGRYRVDVESHKVQKAEWDKPYYKGSSREFTIENNAITEIGVVTCEFSSLKVTVAYTDALKALMGNDVTVTVESNDEGTLVYTPDETRAGYFEVVDGSTSLVATFKGTVDGAYTTQTVTFGEVNAGLHYILTFKVKQGPEPPEQYGGADPSGIGVEGVVSEEDVNGSVDPDDDPVLGGDRPGTGGDEGDDPAPGPGPDDPPVAETISFSSSTLDLDGVNNATTFSGDAIVNIVAENGFRNVIVTIDSEGLTPSVLEGVGLVTTFDLAHPESAVDSQGNTVDITDGLTGLGFPVGDAVTGKTAIDFNITDFVPLLNIYPGKSNFIINVTDQKGNQKSMTLKFIATA